MSLGFYVTTPPRKAEVGVLHVSRRAYDHGLANWSTVLKTIPNVADHLVQGVLAHHDSEQHVLSSYSGNDRVKTFYFPLVEGGQTMLET